MDAGSRDHVRRRGVGSLGLRAVATAAVALLGITMVGVLPAAADGPTTFSNTAAIAIPAAGSPNQVGPASPYPSSIAVSGMSGLVTKVTVTLTGLTHAIVQDVDALLVAPSGQNLMVLSDAASAGGFGVNGATLTFDDAAASAIPDSGVVVSGTYRPSSTGGGDAFPAPAPAPSAQTTLAGAFSGIDPNGSWSLFVVDDATGDVGSLSGGWSLSITTEVTAVATSTSVTTSATTSTTGSPVTFTATVTAGGGPVTTGSVQFTDGAAALGGPVALGGSGTATLTTSGLAEGTHLITATYSGATGFLTSNGSVSQRVDNATVVTGNTYCNPGVMTISSQGAAQPYPSNITVSGLQGDLTAVTVTVNSVSHAVPVDLDVMLSAPSAATNVVLMSDAGGTASVTGASLTFDDAAASGIPSPLTTGTFRPTDDDTGGGDAFAAPAPAPSSATALSAFAGANPNGTWSLWVMDDASGDAGSISGGWCLTLTTEQPTSTALTSSLNPSSFGDAVTFAATVTAGGSPVPAGTVQFADGATALGAAVPVAADGTATFTTSALAVGTHTVSATYSGAAGFAGSTSSVDQVVSTVATSTSLASSVNPSTSGETVTFTATVTAGASPVTTGTMTFADGPTVLATGVALAADGTASFTTSGLSVGSHAVTASYSGTTSLAGSDDTLDQVVQSTVVADAGGPYAIAEGLDLVLDGTGSTAPAGATFAWDVNGDGDYSDASGASPTLTWAQLAALGVDDGPVTGTVALRLTDGAETSDAAATLDIANTPPTPLISGDPTTVVGTAYTLAIGASDPSSADVAAGFSYAVDWGDGSPVQALSGGSSLSVTHTYAASGSFAVSLSATDKDGGTSVVVLQIAADPPAPVPAADAAGPYVIAEGDSLMLDGARSTAGPGAVYEWDVNGDGTFGDAVGTEPTLTWAELEALGIDDGPYAGTMTLRITDGTQSVTDTADLDVVNTAPDSIVTGGLSATVGTLFTVKVGADDPSSADMAATFTYTVDWGDGSAVETMTGPADPPVTHTYVAAGAFSATFSSADKEGAVGAGLIVVVQVQAAPAPPPPGPLPATGVELGWTPLVGAALLLMGAILVLGRRAARRR